MFQIRKALATNVAVVCLTATGLIAGVAHADQSCQALLQEKINYLRDNAGSFDARMSIHREPFNWGVHSSEGATVAYDSASGKLVTGSPNFPLLFSIRYAVTQPFDVSQPDLLTWDISPSGVVHTWNVSWGFDSYYDMACTGSVMTKYFPGFGVVTVNFGRWVAPVG